MKGFCILDEEVVEMISRLSENESQQGFGIDINCTKAIEHLKQKQFIHFFVNLPHMSIINALYISINFKTIQELVNASDHEIKTKARLSDKKAKKLWKFFNDLN